MTTEPGDAMRPGMTLHERQELRRHALDDVEFEVATARRRAAVAYRTIACQREPEWHRTCVAERPGNGGCLCECHDPEETP